MQNISRMSSWFNWLQTNGRVVRVKIVLVDHLDTYIEFFFTAKTVRFDFSYSQKDHLMQARWCQMVCELGTVRFYSS